MANTHQHLHPKIKELQRRTAAISYSNVAVDAQGNLTDLDKRIVKGYVFIWGTRNDRGESFVKGSFSKTISERGPSSKSKMPIKFLAYHNQSRPLSLMGELKEDDIGLYFETVPIDEVSYAADILIGLRSGTLNNFSGGFNPVWSKSEYDETTDTIIHKENNLFEISVVSLASDEDTYQVRSKEEMQELGEVNEEIVSFVDTLPRPYRLKARSLFARQQSLFLAEPPKWTEALEDEKPAKTRASIYNFIKENLNK